MGSPLQEPAGRHGDYSNTPAAGIGSTAKIVALFCRPPPRTFPHPQGVCSQRGSGGERGENTERRDGGQTWRLLTLLSPAARLPYSRLFSFFFFSFLFRRRGPKHVHTNSHKCFMAAESRFGLVFHHRTRIYFSQILSVLPPNHHRRMILFFKERPKSISRMASQERI